jgi:outer membrane receptor for ferrienterochelin and colicins
LILILNIVGQLQQNSVAFCSTGVMKNMNSLQNRSLAAGNTFVWAFALLFFYIISTGVHAQEEEDTNDASDENGVKGNTSSENTDDTDTEQTEPSAFVTEQESKNKSSDTDEGTAKSESSDSAATPTFQGIVLNPTGAPVGGAVVTFVDQGVVITTADDGSFEVALPVGTYNVKVAAANLAPLEEPVELDESANLSGFELLMEFPMEDVVVTGTKTEKLVEKTPVKVQVVGREKIERKKAANLAETLDGTSGVRVESDCQNCGFTQVRLNGLEGRYTQILIDGKPVFSSLAGVYGLEQIPQEMIERVEIVKGGGSALYGGNAVGGVVNVITARPRDNFANITLRGGAVGMEKGEYRLSASTGVINSKRNIAMHVFGGGYTRSPWDANGDGYSEIGKVRQAMAGAETFIDVPHDGELQLKFHVLQEQRRGGNRFSHPEHDADIAESITTRRYGGELRYNQLVNSHFNYDLGYGFAYTERDSYYGGGGNIALNENSTADDLEAKLTALGAYGYTKNPVHVADATTNFAYSGLGDHIITVSGQFMSDGLDDNIPGYNRSIDEVYWNLGGVLQYDWMFADWGEIILGARLDKHSELADGVLSPRAALMFTPREWMKTRTSISTGFRAPQVFDEDLHITMVGGEGAVIRNVDDLEKERSLSLAQQIEFDFDFESGWELKTGVNGFYTKITDAFEVYEDDDAATLGQLELFRHNRGKTTVAGAEVELEVAYGKTWGIGTGWTFEKAENDTPDEDFGEKQLFRTPNVYGYVDTWLNVLDGLEFSTIIDFTGPMKVPHYAGYIAEDRMEESPWFADWNANLSYKIDLKDDRYLSPFIGIKNILDSRQDDYDKGADRDAGYVYGPRMPRTIFAGIKGGI